MDQVSHGADTARLLDIAGELGVSAEQTRDIATSGSAMLTVLAQAWEGPDLEHYARAWESASHAVGDAADRLEALSAELRRQADEQDRGSEGSSRSGGPVPQPAGPTPAMPAPAGPAPAGPQPADPPTDGPNGRGLSPYTGALRRLLEKIYHVPEGLEIVDKGVFELIQTPEGRELLEWASENDVTFEDRGSGGTFYDPTDNVIVLGDQDDKYSIIHELAHARQTAEDGSPSTTDMGRQEYIDAMIDKEVDAMTEEVYYYEATGEADNLGLEGHHVEVYQEARDAALESGASAEDADAAGRDAIRTLFEEGYYQPSSGRARDYVELYGEYWDEDNG